ncbi:MAG: DUF362 domain-containing protein [Deltaproteobacteria bacterium]|nr:DUF362 domain-containing protein [Deltaproteobacteria bacterium]
MKPNVSITKCGNYAFEEVWASVRRSVELAGGIHAFVRRGERILVKPNLLAARPPEAAVTTHPSVVKAVIRLVKEAGGIPIVGDSPAIGSARKVAEKCGVLQVCLEEGAEFVEMKDVVMKDNPKGRKFKRLELARECLEVDGIINLPKFKTHAQMFLTAGVKNIFGCVPGKLKPQWHLTAGVDSAHFADMLLDLYLFIAPRLTILDAIVGMEGNGPGNGTPRHLGFIMASADAVALDTVAAACVGADPMDVPLLKAAGLRGIKGVELEEVTVLGDAVTQVRVAGFRFPPLVSVNFTAKLPYFIDRGLRKALTSRPSIDKKQCTLCNICVAVCPPAIMKKTAKIEINYDTCIRCYCCQEVCPHGAITPVEGWLKRLIPGL